MINKSDLDAVNGEITKLYQKRKIKRHHLEFVESLKVSVDDIPKYHSLLATSGLSVVLDYSEDVVKLFSILHFMKHLRSVKLKMIFKQTECIDNFYGSLHEFPLNEVEHLSIDRFLPYKFLFNV